MIKFPARVEIVIYVLENITLKTSNINPYRAVIRIIKSSIPIRKQSTLIWRQLAAHLGIILDFPPV